MIFGGSFAKEAQILKAIWPTLQQVFFGTCYGTLVKQLFLVFLLLSCVHMPRNFMVNSYRPPPYKSSFSLQGGGDLELDKFRTGQIWSRKIWCYLLKTARKILVRLYSQKKHGNIWCTFSMKCPGMCTHESKRNMRKSCFTNVPSANCSRLS